MQTVIDFNSKVTLKMVVEVVVMAVAVVSMWFNLRAEIKDLSRGLESINKRLDNMESVTWQAMDDYVFMEKYTQVNNLKMPEHKGAN